MDYLIIKGFDRSNLYWGLRLRHIENMVKKNSWVILLGMTCWALYMILLIENVPSLVNLTILR